MIGYLTSQYPATSHTFIRREIAALRAAGLAVRAYSVRPGDAPPVGEDASAGAIFTVLSQPPSAFVRAHLTTLARDPVGYVRTFRLALKHRVPGARALVWALFHFIEAMLLAAQLRRDGIRRLHNHFANPAATVGLLATHYLQLPWSITLHGISEFDYPAGVLLAAKLERVEFAACVSYFGMAQAMRLTKPAIWPRLALVRCAIDPADLPAARPRSGDRDTFELICVGRLSPEKGHAGLLGAMAALVRRGVPVRLTLVGDGPESEALRALARELGIDQQVTFAGRLDEANTLTAIAGADALVLASFMEGLPIVLMEAMALGVPVIASRVAGIPELVMEEETGLLFDPANWLQLEQAIERLGADAALRDRLAGSARARVLEAFTYPGAAAPLRELLQRTGAADA